MVTNSHKGLFPNNIISHSAHIYTPRPSAQLIDSPLSDVGGLPQVAQWRLHEHGSGILEQWPSFYVKQSS